MSTSCDDNHYTTGRILLSLVLLKCPDCIFEINQLWESGFSRVYSNCCCSCSFKPEIIKISQSSHKMYSNNIRNFQGSTTILNAYTKKVRKLIVCTSYIKVKNEFAKYGAKVEFNWSVRELKRVRTKTFQKERKKERKKESVALWG